MAALRVSSFDTIPSYQEHGVVFPVPVLSGAEVDVARQQFEQLAHHLPDRARYVVRPGHYFGWIYRLTTHPRLLAAVEAHIGPNISLLASLLTCKYPGDAVFAPWHQDGTWSGIYKVPNVTAWLALSPSTSENGCMRVIAGSHRHGRREHVKTEDPNCMFRNGDDIVGSVDQAAAVNVRLNAGEMSLHHADIVHGSEANQLGPARIGLIVRFADARYRFEQAWPCFHVRGSELHPENHVTKKIPSDNFEESLMHYRQDIANDPRMNQA